MAELTITRGLPASGKTMWAREQLALVEPGTLVRVNRDDLRRMMLPEDYRYPLPREEWCVTRVQYAAVGWLLAAGVSVIVDDTNLVPEYLRDLLVIAFNVVDATWRVQDFLDVPVGECVARDARRTGAGHVGEHAIRAMHDRHVAPLGGTPMPLPRLADVDRTWQAAAGRTPFTLDVPGPPTTGEEGAGTNRIGDREE